MSDHVSPVTGEEPVKLAHSLELRSQAIHRALRLTFV